MARNEVDTIDLAALVLFPIASGVVFGIWSLQVDVFGGWSPDSVLFSAAGFEATWALLIGLFAIAWIVGTNEIDGSNYEDWEYGGIAAGFLIVPAYEFVPAVANLVDSHDLIALVFWLLTAVVAVYISYTE